MVEIQKAHTSDLVTSAGERDVLSPSSVSALRDPNVVKQIEAGLAGSHTVTKPGRISLRTLLLDDSESIFWNAIQEVVEAYTERSDSIIEGHNEILKSMLEGRDHIRTMLHTRYLNGTVLNPFTPLALCQKMTREQYRSNGVTPLFSESLVTLGIVIAKTQELTERGARVNTGTLFMTDGLASDDSPAARERLSSLIHDMREAGHIIAGMGIGNEDEFRETFEAMGIDPELVYLATDTQEILAAFRMFGKRMEELAAGSARDTVFHM